MYKVPMINIEATGANIKRLRKEARISMQQMQEVFGFVNPQAIYKWERGASMPTIDNMVILASVLNTSIDEILVCT